VNPGEKEKMTIDEKKQLLGKAFWDREIDPDILYAFVNGEKEIHIGENLWQAKTVFLCPDCDLFAVFLGSGACQVPIACIRADICRNCFHRCAKQFSAVFLSGQGKSGRVYH
jgi:hypothetical protein